MHVIAAFAIIAALFAGFHKIETPPKNAVSFSTNGGGIIREQVKPLSEFKNANIVKQTFDYSCGSAALSIVLNHYLGEDLQELQVINGLLKYGDIAAIKRRRAFSLLDMKRFVTVLGYRGEGYKAELKDLEELGFPCIIPLKLNNFYHFVVFRGVYKDHVFIADPSMGNTSFSLLKFKSIWYKNIAFVVYPVGGKGLNALMLGVDDLRVIDSEMERQILASDIWKADIPAEIRAADDMGGAMFYKSR